MSAFTQNAKSIKLYDKKIKRFLFYDCAAGLLDSLSHYLPTY